MKKSIFRLSVLAIGVAAALSQTGCATQNMKDVEAKVQADGVSAQALAEQARVKVATQPLFSKESTFWVDKTPLPPSQDPAAQLPPIFRKDMTFNLQASIPFQELLARLNRSTGLMFTVAQDVYEADPGRTGTNLSALSSNVDATSAAPRGMGVGAAAGGASGSGGKLVDVMISDLIYNGSLAGLLDVVATKANLAWKFDGERVHFFRYETRAFRVAALAGGVKSQAKVSSGAQGKTGGSDAGSSSSSSSQETSMDATADVWSDISASLQAQLSPRGKMSLMPSTGQITVTDTPEKLRRVEQYIKELNKSLSKQVAFNVDVYSVEINDSDNRGVDWNAVWQTMSSKYSLGYQAVGNTASAGGTFTLNLLNSLSGNRSNWNGSLAMVGLLSKIGRTSLVTSTSLVTLNYIPVPVSVTKETAYLKEQETTVSGTSGTAQTALKAGTLTTGFNMNLTPRLGDNDKMLLQFSMDLSDLIGIATFTSPDGKSAIQLPQRNVRNFLQRVSIKSGQTLVLSGFQQTRSDLGSKGLWNAHNWALGGEKDATGANTTLVIMITPYVMN